MDPSSTLRGALQPYAESWEDVLRHLESDRARGLSEAEAAKRLSKHGYNELEQPPPVSPLKRLLRQFSDLVVWILIVAAVISGAVGEWADSLAILSIVLLNGIIGFLQEGKAERALAALQKLSAPMARVVRGGELRSVPLGSSFSATE